ncbi:MAG: class I SAM-dependent methyltransferase, partial [Acidobacteriota bacterium]|nr:class I SAM-dependent methyltransferase [Acidobacteriota bacterium]
MRESKSRSFEELLQFYYEITPEVPTALAGRYMSHTMAQVCIAHDALRAAGFQRGRTLLDVGCSTGGLLVASHEFYDTQVGLDVALRWLVVARVRLTEFGLKPLLVCGNAEALPFPDRIFNAITLIDVLEHVRDAGATLRETHR